MSAHEKALRTDKDRRKELGKLVGEKKRDMKSLAPHSRAEALKRK